MFSSGTRFFICDLIEPPRPIQINLYRCDKRFHTDPLKTIMQENRLPKLGVVYVTGTDCALYTVQGSCCTKVSRASTHRQNGTRRGGQSAPRFQRIRDQETDRWKTIIGKQMMDCWFNQSTKKAEVQGILMAGNGPILRDTVLSRELRPYLLERISVDELKLCELYDQYAEALETGREETEHQEHIQTLLDTGSTLLVYGMKQLTSAIRQAGLKQIYLTPKRIKTINADMCEAVGCKITRVRATELMRMLGGAVGVRWYSSM